MKTEYQLLKNKLFLTNTEVYSNEGLKNLIIKKLAPIFFFGFVLNKSFKAYNNYLEDESALHLIFFILFCIVCLALFIWLINVIFLTTWKRRHNINDISEILVVEDNSEVQLTLKLNYNKSAVYTFRILENEHQRFLDDIQKKKSLLIKYHN